MIKKAAPLRLFSLGLQTTIPFFLALSSSHGLAADLKSDKAKMSYVIGQQIGNSIKQQGFDIDTKVLAESISDAYAGKKSQLSEKDIAATMEKLKDVANQQREELMKKAEAAAATNKKESEAFLETNKKKKDVKITDSGLQYSVIKEGKGKSPAESDEVTVHYKGTLVNGEEFDSSYKRGEPATFALNQVIKGWTEGLQLMKEGAKYRFYIPSDLAYGPSGRPGIPGNSALIFDVELISITQ